MTIQARQETSWSSLPVQCVSYSDLLRATVCNGGKHDGRAVRTVHTYRSQLGLGRSATATAGSANNASRPSQQRLMQFDLAFAMAPVTCVVVCACADLQLYIRM